MTKICSVVVLSYESKIEQLTITLESILSQKGIEFEVIVSDDGSKENNYNFVKSYFKEKNFTNYRLINNLYNKGTVKNIIDCLKICKEDYVKCIGAGDALFDCYTLRDMCNSLDEGDFCFSFGLMKKYCFGNQGLKVRECINPGNLKVYLDMDYKKIKYDSIVLGKYISGACMIYNKNKVLPLMEKLCGWVRYCEDYFQVLALLENEKVGYIDKMVIWYESVSGISTSNSQGALEKMDRDRKGFLKILGNEYVQNNYVKKLMKRIGVNKISNRAIRAVVKGVVMPQIYIVDLKTKYQEKKGYYYKCSKGFFDDITFLHQIKIIKNRCI